MGLAGASTAAEGYEAEGRAAARAALYNAELARIEGRRAVEAGYEEEARVRTEAKRHAAIRRTQTAKQGIGLEGTPLRALVADARQFEIEALRARRGGLEAGQAASMTADLETKRASSVRRIGKQAGRGTLLSGFSQGLMGLGQAGLTFYQLRHP
jgi:hypothetical protein